MPGLDLRRAAPGLPGDREGAKRRHAVPSKAGRDGNVESQKGEETGAPLNLPVKEGKGEGGGSSKVIIRGRSVGECHIRHEGGAVRQDLGFRRLKKRGCGGKEKKGCHFHRKN